MKKIVFITSILIVAGIFRYIYPLPDSDDEVLIWVLVYFVVAILQFLGIRALFIKTSGYFGAMSTASWSVVCSLLLLIFLLLTTIPVYDMKVSHSDIGMAFVILP